MNEADANAGPVSPSADALLSLEGSDDSGEASGWGIRRERILVAFILSHHGHHGLPGAPDNSCPRCNAERELDAVFAELEDWKRIGQSEAFKALGLRDRVDEAEQGVEYALACIAEWQQRAEQAAGELEAITDAYQKEITALTRERDEALALAEALRDTR